MGEVPLFLTRAAEGLDRRGFSMADVEKMIEAGILEADERFELIDGEIVPMNPQALPHLNMKARLARALLATCPADIDIAQDATIVFGERSFFDADVLAYGAAPGRRYIEPDQVLLAVEVADSSRARDLFTKAPRYGAAGVRELWVVELNEEITYVFRAPATPRWSEPERIAFSRALSPLFLPDAAIRLSTLL
jgi:Uma2 family endonuclease